MELTVKINLDNAQFQAEDMQEDDMASGLAASLLLQRIGASLEYRGVLGSGAHGNSVDDNGNTVGHWKID